MTFKTRNEKILFFFIVLFVGAFGVHWFILKKYRRGVLYLFSIGGLTLLWFYDSCRAFISIFKEHSLFEKYICSDKVKNEIYIQEVNESKQVKINNPSNYVPDYIYNDAYNERKTNRLLNSYVVIDCETTGLDPSQDRIIELSAIKYIKNKEVDTFSYLVNPKRKIGTYITELTGIEDSDLENQPTIDEIMPLFIEFIKDYLLVAHNAPFDIKMIVAEAYRSNITFPDNQIQDTLKLAKRLYSKDEVKNHKLKTLKKYLGLKYDSHRALDDCYTCAAIYQAYYIKKRKKS